MAIPTDETVVVRRGPRSTDPTEITVNCPDKVGLGCDVTRIIFEFGLTVVRGDLSTDGRWCFLVFWVLPQVGGEKRRGEKSIKWSLLKQRMTASCPSSEPVFLPITIKAIPKRREMYLFQICSIDRPGFLNDVTQVLWEAQLTIRKVNVTTSPDGKAVDFFFVTDNRDELPSKHRVEDVCETVQDFFGDPKPQVSCTFEGKVEGKVDGPEGFALSPALPATVEEHLLPEKLPGNCLWPEKMMPAEKVVSSASVTVDNSMSPAHSVLQIAAEDRKGILFDCLRLLKDVCIQVSYGRVSTSGGTCIIDVFIQDSKNGKLNDIEKQKELCAKMKRELECPIRITLVTKGPDSELLIACPMEGCGRGRPRVLYDVTFVLRQLELHVFKADISRHRVCDRQWEVYRFILQDKLGLPVSHEKSRVHLENQVRNILMG